MNTLQYIPVPFRLHRLQLQVRNTGFNFKINKKGSNFFQTYNTTLFSDRIERKNTEQS